MALLLESSLLRHHLGETEDLRSSRLAASRVDSGLERVGDHSEGMVCLMIRADDE